MRLISLIIAFNLTGFVFGAEGNIDQRKLKRLRDNDPSLTMLLLERIQIRDNGVRALAEALKTNTSLTDLSLYWNQIGALGARALTEALKINTNLTSLNLIYTQIGDAETGVLAEALKVNTSLTKLYLEDNQIGDDGATAIAEALKVNTSLTILDLDYNQIGDELKQEIERLISPEGLYHERRALVPWSIPRHLELASWNLHVIPVVKTICLIELRSREDDFHLPCLPIEIWLEILKFLKCGDFGPLALPAP